jgi:hypothetical protein
MSRWKHWSWFAVAFIGTMTTGCVHKMTLEQMKAQMPKRPAELDRLNPFVGKWSFEGEAKFAMLDEPLKMTGHGEYAWEGDRWYMVGHNVMKMDGFDECKGLETWTYDTKAGKYRSTWVDSMGTTGMGAATYDVDTRTWHMSAVGYGPWGESKMKGTMHLKDDNTLVWYMTETQGLTKVAEMMGTAKRER